MSRTTLVALACLACACRGPQPTDINAVPDRYRPLYEWVSYDQDMEPLWAALPFESIELQFQSYGGSSYHLRLNRGGAASQGSLTGEVDYYSYARLCFQIERLRVAEMQSKYGFAVVDGGSYTFRLVGPSGAETVVKEHEGQGPPELHALVICIESIKDGIRWKWPPVKEHDRLQTRLTTEPWYVHSFAFPGMSLQGVPIEFSAGGAVTAECLPETESYLLTSDLELRLGGSEPGTRLFFTYDREAKAFASRSQLRPPIVIAPAGFKITDYTNGF